MYPYAWDVVSPLVIGQKGSRYKGCDTEEEAWNWLDALAAEKANATDDASAASTRRGKSYVAVRSEIYGTGGSAYKIQIAGKQEVGPSSCVERGEFVSVPVP